MRRLPKLKTTPTQKFEYKEYQIEYIPISGWDVFKKGSKFLTRIYHGESAPEKRLVLKEVDKMVEEDSTMPPEARVINSKRFKHKK